MRFTDEEMIAALQELNAKQKPMQGLFGAIIGAFVGFVFYLFISQMGAAIIIMLAVPPASIGLFARFTGQMYSLKYRLPVGAIGALLHIFGCYMLGLTPLAYILTPVAFIIAVTLSKVKLERVHIWAISQEEIGKLNAK
ncbi:MAG: hypothetical protein AAF364_20415 [Pseudomonadota bacterium]